ncbi:hypothetical protein BT96DRAFT_222001 [Gymnopus androsaceus JB14]|uniref:Carbohydrate-binding module family 50 protein n=1 Tax=Gymnopus androsaceus JB14 TaxID=1447944 RepID=A0A6A4I7M1_9AGAR|nr:hypothetical protein BT96DRAFT_222001 [Gymnopus androsaceus JB14]
MSRWTQYEEDACRLPEGFKRIAYDADTARYTFRDREGALWLSKPGESYGKLMPVSPNGKNVESWRYDDDDDGERQRPRLKLSDSPVTSFHEFLPEWAITSASSTSPTSSSSRPQKTYHDQSPCLPLPRARFIDAARRSTMPKMQGVVHNLRRSVTVSKQQKNAKDSEKGNR